MAKQKFLDTNGVLYLWGKIKSLIDNKLLAKGDNLKIEGNKLGLYSGAQKLNEVLIPTSGGGGTPNPATGDYNDLINQPQINGHTLTGNLTTEQLGINIPSNISQLNNDSEFQTQSQVQQSITQAIQGVVQFNYQIVYELPSTGTKGTIYLKTKTGGGENDTFEEYIYINNKFEKLGEKNVDLSGYLLATDVVAISNSEIDSIAI